MQRCNGGETFEMSTPLGRRPEYALLPKPKVRALRLAHPERLPVVVHVHHVVPDLPDFKFLVPLISPMWNVLHATRNQLRRKDVPHAETKALVLFVQGRYLVPQSAMLRDLAASHCDEDGAMHVVLREESVFGGTTGA